MNWEVVECCPHCETENVYPNWDVEKQGYIATCECGKKIFLCSECLDWSEDNTDRVCDWTETEDGAKCFRGEIKYD